MKSYLIVCYFTVMSFFVSYSQNNYPIQTVLKGDSVIIMTTEQYQNLELISDNQKARIRSMKSQIDDLNKIFDTLNNEIAIKSDSLNEIKGIIEIKLSDYDSLTSRIKDVENFLYYTSIDNAYIYYSYTDSTIMLIDLSSYILIGNRRTGNFSLVRRGTSDEDAEWKKCNRLYPQEPKSGWELYYKKRCRPVVLKFPYQINGEIK